VALHWAGEPAGLSTSMGVASVGGLVDAAAAYKLGATGVDMATAIWEAGGSVSIEMEEVSLVRLEAGVLALAVGEPRKV